MNNINKFKIDEILFEKGFSKSCSPVNCETSCCKSGVYLDPTDKEKIMPYISEIKNYMDETQSKDENLWFDETKEVDSDFPSGYSISTRVINDKCALLRNDGKCSLQVFGKESGLGSWAIKPHFCIAFPITVENGILTFDDYRQGETKCCSIINDKNESLVKSCNKELIFVLGEDGYKDLLQMENDFNKK